MTNDEMCQRVQRRIEFYRRGSAEAAAKWLADDYAADADALEQCLNDARRWSLLEQTTDGEALDNLAAAADIVAFQHQVPHSVIADLVQQERGWIALLDAALDALPSGKGAPWCGLCHAYHDEAAPHLLERR